MDEYISREAAIEALSAEALERNLDSVMTDDAHRYHRAADRVIAGVPAADVVLRDAFNRILAENDDMRAMLAQIGKKPGDSMDDIRLAVYTVKEAIEQYGVDVTKLWQTATAQKSALDAAYVRGKNDAYKQSAAKAALNAIIEGTRAFPPADVRPAVHGQWIYDCERTMGDGWTYKQRHCSKCGYQTVERDNFCQHCGAIMDA